MKTFFLGTHQVDWLERTDVPLFLSRRRLAQRKRLPRARGPWALDSGGFSELSEHGRWTVDARTYVAEVRRFSAEIGQLVWATAQDWMCEPWILQKTGLTVSEHQRRTVENYEELCELAPEVPWVPVLQGWTHGDYLDQAEFYEQRGHALAKLPTVGLGSICRRQATLRASLVVRWLADDGVQLHGFGFKTQGLLSSAEDLQSANSLAWSLNARKNKPHPDCTHANCSNCSCTPSRGASRCWRASKPRRLLRTPAPARSPLSRPSPLSRRSTSTQPDGAYELVCAAHRIRSSAAHRRVRAALELTLITNKELRMTMTRNEYVAAHASMGRNPRLRRLVPRTRNAAGVYVDVILTRLHSARVNRIRSNRSLTSEERLALAVQRSYFARLLSNLPTPRLP